MIEKKDIITTLELKQILSGKTPQTIENYRVVVDGNLHTITPFADLKFIDCEFEHEISIFGHGGTNIHKIEIENSIINNKLIIRNYHSDNSKQRISLNKIHYSSLHSILQISRCNGIKIFNQGFLAIGQIHINYCENIFYSYNLPSLHNHDSEEINFSISHNKGSQFNIFELHSGTFDFVNNTSCKLELNSGIISVINLLKLSNSQIIIGNNLYKLKVKKVDLKRGIIEKDTEITLQNGTFDKLNFSSIINKGIIQIIKSNVFNKDEKDSGIDFRDSNMGVTIITNCFLTTKKINLDGAFLMDMKLSGVMWPAKNIIDENFKERSTIELIYLRDTYRQLKAISINAKDIVNALKFKANEMNTYYYILHKSRLKHIFPLKWRSDFFELFFSKWSSNFGLSIGQPLFFIFAFHALWLYILLNHTDYSTLHFTLDKSLMTLDAFKGCTYEFFKFLNPVRKFNPNVHPALDIVMRLSVGYFAYHLIRATRKFAKL